MHGCGALFRWLLDNDLVDEMTLFIFPVVLGQGTRLFPDTGRDRALELVESRATPSGVTIQDIGGKTRMSIVIEFPTVEAMEQHAAMGMEEGLTQAVGQIDAILAEQSVGQGTGQGS